MKETRRVFVKKLGYSIAVSSMYAAGANKLFAGNTRSPQSTKKRFLFNANKDRVWIGEDFCAIPMEDWSVRSGKISFNGSMQNSRVTILTTKIEKETGRFKISASLGIDKADPEKAGSAGFLIGIRDAYDDDVRAACYYGKGLPAGISTDGYLMAGQQKKPLPKGFSFENIRLECEVKRRSSTTTLKVTAYSKGLNVASEVALDEDISGYLALVNNIEDGNGTRFWFRDLEIEGEKLVTRPEQGFGPILWTMYTLHNKVLKMSVQMPPLADDDEKELILLVRQGGAWKEVQRQQIDNASCQGVFKIADWDTGRDIPYKVNYYCDGKLYQYKGLIRKEPGTRPLRFAGLTCQHWQAYPYTPLVKNLEKHDPDMLFFSGDQLYEGNGGYGVKRSPVGLSILSYLGKWFMFGWTFGNIMRDRPTICTPDDHDVFHGNLWGEGGESLALEEWSSGKHKDAHGGYVQSPEMINVVHRTNCAHLPDCPDPESLPSGISTWYTEVVYGGISFAIVSDRMFKSGPEEVREGGGRIDHVKQPLRPGELERQDLQFLGKRQMAFLNRWIGSWEGAGMKVLLSQTLFSNVSTHHGNDKMFLYGDMDAGGWPKHQRDEVIKILRKGYAFHINGDQHLPYIVQYSVDDKRDGGWTFCTPAISTGYIRWGEPDLVNVPFSDRPEHQLPNTGCYRDGFGNDNYVYAVGNPLDNWRDKNRYRQAQNKSSGFGIVTFDLTDRTILMEAYRFLSDKDRPSENDQFPGWPLKIRQTDNDGRKFQYYLPLLKLNKADQVVKVLNRSGELINVLRLRGSSHQFQVPDKGIYYLEAGEGENVKRSGKLTGRNQNNDVLEIEV